MRNGSEDEEEKEASGNQSLHRVTRRGFRYSPNANGVLNGKEQEGFLGQFVTRLESIFHTLSPVIISIHGNCTVCLTFQSLGHRGAYLSINH